MRGGGDKEVDAFAICEAGHDDDGDWVECEVRSVKKDINSELN